MDKYYWYWLSNIPGIGPVKIRHLLEMFERPENIYEASGQELCMVKGISQKDAAAILDSKKDKTIYENYFHMQKDGILIAVPSQKEYPARLRNIYDMPACLYYKGALPDSSRPAVAIVGSRSCSAYGRAMAEKLGEELAAAGVDIISGLAVGIDACGHRGALKTGKTYAILGCGVDICYPASNRFLYDQLQKNGGVISEYPPHTVPAPGLFPMRNRIISGMSDLVIVVEARKKSGSLITADQALEQSREVMAVPGRMTDVASEGCNHLIKQGAGIVTDTADVLEALEIICPERLLQNQKKNFILAPEEEMVYSGLDFSPKSIEDLVAHTGYTPARTMDILMRLVLKGAAEENAHNYYIKGF